MASALQGLGLGLLIAFGWTFGVRWGLLAAAVVLLFLGVALSDAPLWARRPPAVPAVPPDGQVQGVWFGEPEGAPWI